MTTPEALLAAVLASPDDELPRLVYADWLDENGQSERAEFVRCNDPKARRRMLGRLAPKLLADIHFPLPLKRQTRRGARNNYMVGEDGATVTLFNIPAAGGAWPELVFRRGFVAEVRCTLADWCGGECGRCNPHLSTYVPFNNDGMCLTCRDTGRTSGIGVQVSEKHPVQTVTITDRDPTFGTTPTFRWTDASEPNPLYSFRSHPQNQLPHDLFRLVNGNMKVPNQSPYIKWFPTKEYALSALSTALIAWAKAQVASTPVVA